MKKLLTLLAAMVVAVSLSMPVFAQEAQAEGAAQTAPAKKAAKKKHAAKKKAAKKKKGKKGKKAATEPAPGQ